MLRPFGRTGLLAHPLGIGCMRLPVLDDGAVDRPAAVALLREALDSGATHFDTAHVYHGGTSESVLGEALAEGRRDRAFISTKSPVWEAKTEAYFDRLLDESLARLRTDRIDLYLLHALQGATWGPARDAGALAFLDRAKRDGRIRFAGFSFHDGPGLFREICDAYPWDACLLQFNYMDVEFQAGLSGIRHAHARGMAVMAMEPLRGGRLVKRVPEDVLAAFAAAREGRSPAAWALRFVLDHPEIAVVYSGMGTRGQLRENLATAEGCPAGSLSAAERAALARARDLFRARFKVHCTECGYCMPCPRGVAIPLALDVYNSRFAYGQDAALEGFYRAMAAEGQGAGRCDRCGACEARCPQGVPIREALAAAHELFGGGEGDGTGR